MTKAEAKRRVCAAAAQILDPGHENAYLHEGFKAADAARMEAALEELCAELWRRGGKS